MLVKNIQESLSSLLNKTDNLQYYIYKTAETILEQYKQVNYKILSSVIVSIFSRFSNAIIAGEIELWVFLYFNNFFFINSHQINNSALLIVYCLREVIYKVRCSSRVAIQEIIESIK